MLGEPQGICMHLHLLLITSNYIYEGFYGISSVLQNNRKKSNWNCKNKIYNKNSQLKYVAIY